MKLDDFMEKFSVLKCRDNYGRNMTESSLADWLEFAALMNVHASWSTVTDSWKDVGLQESDKSNVLGVGETYPADLMYYDLALAEIRGRSVYLGNSYPFEFNQFQELTIRPSFNISDSVYIDLLLISLLKGYIYEQNDSAGVLHPLTDYFEQLTNACILTGLGRTIPGMLFHSSVIGTSGHEKTFEERLQHTAKELDLVVDPTACPHSAKVKDDGVDIICGIVWKDGRKNDLLWAIQAACGASSVWETKLRGIKPNKWAAYFDEYVEPRALIAIPYHLTERALLDMIDALGNESYLDRLRLVRLANGNAAVHDKAILPLRTRIAQLTQSKLGIQLQVSQD